MDWSEDNIAWLKDLHAQGLSMSTIARVMGQGLTRNAVLGKIHRLGLPPARPNGARDAAVQVRRQLPGYGKGPIAAPKLKKLNGGGAAKVAELAPLAGPDGQAFTMRTSRGDQCKWIPGEDTSPDAPICGHAVHLNSPWCEHHFNRVHTAVAAAAANNVDAANESASADRTRGRTRA